MRAVIDPSGSGRERASSLSCSLARSLLCLYLSFIRRRREKERTYIRVYERGRRLSLFRSLSSVLIDKLT